MSNKPPIIVRRAAVLGAGVMGAQIAAHLVNAGVETVLFELAADGPDPYAHVNKAIKGLAKLKPAPLASPERIKLITPAHYEGDLEMLRGCDLVIEAVAERIDIKESVYSNIAPFLNDHVVIASNTSGLGINELADVLPQALQPNFCGVHFFNPPRYMKLVELIPCVETQGSVMDALESFLVTTMGKGVVRARDTRNFIGNRIGVFAMLAAVHHGMRLDLPLELVDALTGKAIGRPKSATYRTLDVVGLDTMTHVVEGSVDALKALNDPWVEYYQLPKWLHDLLDAGALGQKTRKGVYFKDGKEIKVYDAASGSYRAQAADVDPTVKAILAERDLKARFAALIASDHPQAEFLWAIHRDTFHYAAVLLESIADNARDLDAAIRWGFGWKQGPFEIWQAAGWRVIADQVKTDIDAGKAMASVPLPAWVSEIESAHSAEGSWSASAKTYRGVSNLPVYQRQLKPGTSAGDVVLDADAVTLRDTGDGIASLSFKTKMHTVTGAVLEGIHQSLDLAERDFRGVVLWQPEAPFSAGANIQEFLGAIEQGNYDAIDTGIARFQEGTMRLRYSYVPVVAAAQGLALGGGCELLLHSDRVVAAIESYIGLVEVGVGLIPGGGGLKELALRAAQQAPNGDPFPALRNFFELVGYAKVSASADEAQRWGYLRPSDIIIFNPDELLHVARAQAIALAEAGYRPPLPRKFVAAGRSAAATLEASLVNMLEGGFISAHDHKLGKAVASVLCGGDVDAGSEIDEAWLLRLEREYFVELSKTDETKARIGHMLKTGKPLRN